MLINLLPELSKKINDDNDNAHEIELKKIENDYI